MAFCGPWATEKSQIGSIQFFVGPNDDQSWAGWYQMRPAHQLHLRAQHI